MGTRSSVHRPRLILMAGFPGVGKSTVARAIARQTHMVVFDKDDLLSPILRSNCGLSPQSASWLAYEILLDLVTNQLASGHHVIVDSCLTYQWLRDRLVRIAHDVGADPVFIHLHCPTPLAERRIAIREEAFGFRQHRAVSEHQRIKDIFEPFRYDLPIHNFDASLETTQLVSQIIETLNFL